MKNANLAALLAAPLMIVALSLPALADSGTPTNCKDGTTSTATGKGACSGHGGVQKTPAAAPAAPAASTPAAAAPAASGTSTTCKDGTTSTATGKGACSGHGGVQKAKPAADTAAAAATAMTAAPAKTPASAASTDPTGATAKCKDGTYSKSTHKAGTCSNHGGVAQWLTAAQ